jgi:heme-degrading monooxygenase HmoA
MYARVNRFEGSADHFDEGIRDMEERIVPWTRETDGCKGMMTLVDRESGKMIAITLWESQDKMLASESEAAGVRAGSAEVLGGTPSVERYEVAIWEM